VPEKAGGIASNIGIHFFDMLIWIFGGIKDNVVHLYQPDAAAGYLELKHASVSWFLSVNYEYVPDDIKAAGQRTYRSITVDDEEMEFSGGFADLHTKSYKDILSGGGFDLEQARQSIETVHAIRVSEVKGLVGDYHPFAKKVTGR
jgi:UDP-N-acetyl-2-amino-2-deoxyglucuronate dehydrogenase